MRTKLSENFYRDEFECRCGCGYGMISTRLVQGLQRLRDIIDAPIHVNSGCRCVEHNAAVGGSKKSQHVLGKAADITANFHSPEDLAEIAEDMFEFSDSGIGLYDNFLHLDVRNGKARWDYRKNK